MNTYDSHSHLHTHTHIHTQYTHTHTHTYTHNTHTHIHTHTHTQCGNMAREGLRTLVVGKRGLTEEQYASFEVSADPVTGRGCGYVPLASCVSISYLRRDTSKQSSASQTDQPRYGTASCRGYCRKQTESDGLVQEQRSFTGLSSSYLCFNYILPDWFMLSHI